MHGSTELEHIHRWILTPGRFGPLFVKLIKQHGCSHRQTRSYALVSQVQCSVHQPRPSTVLSISEKNSFGFSQKEASQIYLKGSLKVNEVEEWDSVGCLKCFF